MAPLACINGYTVLEYGYFPRPVLPMGYVLPPNGHPALKPVQNLAICTADGVDWYYLLFCAPDWEYVTYEFNETLEYTRRAPLTEFGVDVIEWHNLAEPNTTAAGGA